MRRWAPIACLVAACSSEGVDARPSFTPEPAEELGLAASTPAATFDDPVLLTFTALRPYARYLVDEGYTLDGGDPTDRTLAFVNALGGELALGFFVDGAQVTATPSITHVTSNGVVLTTSLGAGLSAEVRFVAASSSVGALEIVVTNGSSASHAVTLAPTLRRCADGFSELRTVTGGVALAHLAEVDALTRTFAKGTYVEDRVGALVAEDPNARPILRASCDARARDVAAVARGEDAAASEPKVVGLSISGDVGPGARRAYRVHRVVVARDDAPFDAALASARGHTVPALLREGAARLAAIPPLPKAFGAFDWAYRSSFVLLEGLMLPAEGKLKHDYYLFSREPTWWFARLGQHIHESLSMLLYARLDPKSATETQRNFLARVEKDGYLPYNIGPAVEQTAARTASAPLLDYVSWELYQANKDAAFLAEAYDAGKRVHEFWLRERDVDKDGLAEWGGFPVTESLRDLENVIWEKVAQPNEVEAVDLNSMLVMEEKTLAKMADALGKPDEAAGFRAQADARAAKINATNWDEVTGFYYHVARDTGSFSFKTTDDLKHMEIAGFMPLWAGIVPKERVPRVLEKLTDPTLFWRAAGVPGLNAKDPFYSAEALRCCRWNGPVWVPWMLLLHRALVSADRPDLARTLTERTHAAVTAQLRRYHQFRELYDADDASRPNTSMPNYCWSALVAEMMLEDP